MGWASFPQTARPWTPGRVTCRPASPGLGCGLSALSPVSQNPCGAHTRRLAAPRPECSRIWAAASSCRACFPGRGGPGCPNQAPSTGQRQTGNSLSLEASGLRSRRLSPVLPGGTGGGASGVFQPLVVPEPLASHHVSPVPWLLWEGSAAPPLRMAALSRPPHPGRHPHHTRKTVSRIGVCSARHTSSCNRQEAGLLTPSLWPNAPRPPQC